MKNKKILLLHHSNDLGGAGMSLLSIYKMLVNKFDISIYIPKKDSELGHFLMSKKVKIKEVGFNLGMISYYSGGPKVISRTFLKNLLQIKKSRKRIKEIVKKEHPDFIAINSLTLCWVGLINFRKNLQKICFIRETLKNKISDFIIKKIIDINFHQACFISRYDKEKFDFSRANSHIIYDCVDSKYQQLKTTRKEACKKLKIKNENFNVLFLGGNDELKGWSIIKACFDTISNNNIKLIVAGKSDKKNTDSIKFIGTQTNMPLVYKSCDVLVFPSTSPHQARPVFESGFFKKPIIISNFLQTKEFVKNNFNGLEFYPKDIESLKNCIFELYRKKDKIKKLGENNFLLSKRNHTEDKVSLKLKKVFE